MAVHADACLARFEQWAVGKVFARPAALDDTPAGEAAAAAAFTAQEETDLDARLHAARCRLAAVRRRGCWAHTAVCCLCALPLTRVCVHQARASVAAMQAECTSLDAELASSQVAMAQLESLAAAAGAKENAATTATQLVVALTEFVPLLDTAEALAAQGTAACGAPALPDGAFVCESQCNARATSLTRGCSLPSPLAPGAGSWRAAMPAVALADVAAFNARLHQQ